LADGGQLADQAALLGLEARSGVMATRQDGRSSPWSGRHRLDGIQAGSTTGIADAMQERRRYQHVAILGRKNCRHTARLASDRLDMRPPVA
jgi:hypothetical protein